MAFWRKNDDDVEAVLRKVGKRDGFRWVRRLDDAELTRLAENVRSELDACDSRDELLERRRHRRCPAQRVAERAGWTPLA